jgi:hypothetical protein
MEQTQASDSRWHASESAPQPSIRSTQLPTPPHAAAQGVAQAFGLHPAVALMTIAVDWMLFGGEIVTLGVSLFFSVVVAVVLGFITYRAQMKFYGDDSESAAIKACILALLTAIPTGLPSFLFVPAGIVGFFRKR